MLEHVAQRWNLILESFRQFRSARERVECLAQVVRGRDQEVCIAPVKEIKLIRFLADDLHGPPRAVAFSYPLDLPERHKAPAKKDAQISDRLGHAPSLSTMRRTVLDP